MLPILPKLLYTYKQAGKNCCLIDKKKNKNYNKIIKKKLNGSHSFHKPSQNFVIFVKS
jgi:hypothetical protein